MKHFSPGLSDSIASVISDPAKCPHCDSSSHIAGGLCVGCLLQSGLELGDECAPETLVSALAEITLPDKNWRLGNYEILEEIGRGGMGVIYRARQRHSRRIVAVKRVLGYHADSRETLARFRREAQAAASLDHPNILPIYEVSESEDGLPFFSMKFAPGGSLQEVGPALRNEPRQCVALVAKIARAVQHAHGKGILHRDLKPGNILLDGSGEPLVSDFGLAKWLDTTSDLTRTLTIFGTPGYIAPEQAIGPAAQLKPAADVYSLGAILFDLLAGRPPFLGAHALSVIRQASETSAPKLRTLSKIDDRDLETICAHCLEREPSARYCSAHDLAEDLEHWLEGRPIIARPVLPPVRIWRWSKRNRMLAGTLAICAILGVLGLTAQITQTRLSKVVRNAEMTRNSIVTIPFEDLDELSTTSNSAHAATTAFTDYLRNTKGIYLRQPGKVAENVDPWRPEDWKRVGETAGARMVLSGTVREREGRQRIATRLIEAATGSVVCTWLQDAVSLSDTAKESAMKISDIFGRKKELTQEHGSVVSEGNLNATGDTHDASARSYYERGKELFFRNNLPDLARAIDSFQTAIEIDPNYGQSYALLASACLIRSAVEPSGRWLEQAESAAAAALRIAPMLPEAYQAMAGTLEKRGRLQESIDPHLIAYELDPANGRAAAILGYIYDTLGHPDLGLLWFEKAARRETRPLYADNIGDAWTSLGDYMEAEKAYKTAAIFRPDLPVGMVGLSRLDLFRGNYEGARTECAAARDKYKDHPQPLIMAAQIEFFTRQFAIAEKLYREASAANRTGGVDFTGSVRFLSALGFIRLSSGAETEGKALLEEARELDDGELLSMPNNLRRLYSLAANYSALGNSPAAIATLGRAVQAGWIDYRSMELDPRFDSIRDDQTFKDTLARLTNKVREMRRQGPSRKLALNLSN